MSCVHVSPVAHVRGGRAAPEDGNWGGARVVICLEEAFAPDALLGLEAFSHAEIVFRFRLVPDARIETGARRPLGNPDWPLVGIFAQRGRSRPNRPNLIGVTVCRIVSLSGREIAVEGLDAIEGTPVLDIKPVMREFLPRGDIRQPDWSRDLMKDYW